MVDFQQQGMLACIMHMAILFFSLILMIALMKI